MHEIIFIVPYSHIDWGWGYYLGPSIREISKANSRIVFEALKVLEKYSEYKWSGVDKVYTFFSFWVDYPELRDKLKTYIMDGRIDIACGMVSTPHMLGIACTYCCGESFIRNIVYGRRFLEKMLGFKFKNILLQLNDLTGMFSQLPQIALKCGYRFLKIGRPKEIYDSLNIPMNFYWQSPDGSKILCNRSPYGSGWKSSKYRDFEEARKVFMEDIEKRKSFCRHKYILFYQGGDFEPPDIGLIKFVEEWNKRGLKPRLKISTPTEYFEAIEGDSFPVYSGSLDNVSWAFLYGIGGDKLRRVQRNIVNLLLTCEKFCTIASLFNHKYPGEILEDLWIREVLWEDHNSLAYLYPEDLEEALKSFKYIEEEAYRLLYSSLHHIASKINFSKNARQIVVFNQLAWDREDIVDVKIFFKQFNGNKYFKIVDENGDEVPYQKIDVKYGLDGSIEEARIVFKANVPSLGYKVYYVIPSDHEVEYSSDLKIFFEETYRGKICVLENSFYRIRILNGQLLSIFDKKLGREVLKTLERSCLGNSILCEEIMSGAQGLTGKVVRLLYSSSQFPPDRVEVVENGPIRVKVRSYFNYLENPTILEVTLYSNSPRIEFKTIIEAKCRERRFRVIFPLNILNGELRVHKPFHLEKIFIEKERYDAGERSNGGMGKVFGSHEFIDYSNKDWGVTFISRQNAGFILDENVVSNILSTTIDPSCLYRFRKCPVLTELGRYEFEYALYIHGKTDVEKIYRAAEEYLNPLIHIYNVHGSGEMPETFSFIEIFNENIVLSSLFRDGDDIVVRLFEIDGRRTQLSLKFFKNIEKIWETDFIGNVVGEDKIVFNPYQIKDVRIKV